MCLFFSGTKVWKCQTTEDKLWRDWCIWRIVSRETFFCWIQEVHRWLDHKRICKKGRHKNTWKDPVYPPYWVYHHPSKPGKIRVDFDCSAEFDERSLNRELLTGPDLTNQIVGVLTRFQQNSIAFMADIEAMYYQVMVSEHQQTFIKFVVGMTQHIWRSNQLCNVYLCLWVSSSSCACYANYANYASIDNVERFGKEAAAAIYADDLLKSVKDLDTAKTLVKNVINMCRCRRIYSPKVYIKQQEIIDFHSLG